MCKYSLTSPNGDDFLFFISLETIKNSIGQMEQGIHANKSTLLSIIGKSKI